MPSGSLLTETKPNVVARVPSHSIDTPDGGCPGVARARAGVTFVTGNVARARSFTGATSEAGRATRDPLDALADALVPKRTGSESSPFHVVARPEAVVNRLGGRGREPVDQPPEYKPTLFDRHGPDAFVLLVAAGHGVLVAGTTAMVLGLYGLLNIVTLVVCIAAGFGTFALGVRGAQLVERAVRRVTMGGTSTPYKEQYSREQALVMQGRVDDALASFEAIIAADPTATTARIRAAELYARDRDNAERAGELLREVQRTESCSAGEHVYAAHRLVDLYTGPLNDPGRALVELRRLIERFPTHPAAAQAREALAVLKARHQTAAG